MLESLKLVNFKSIVNNVPIGFSEYSILCGSNSSGKSSIIQALLMVSQTMSSRFSQGTIALNGHLVRLGAFKDIINYRTPDENITIDFVLNFKEGRRWPYDVSRAECRFCFGKTQLKVDSAEDELHPSIIKAEFKVFKSDGAVDELHFENPAFYSDPDSATFGLYKITKLKTSDLELIAKEFPDYKILGCEKNSFIPADLKLEYDYTKKISAQVLELFVGSGARKYRSPFSRNLDETKIVLPRALFRRLKDLIENERRDTILNFEFTPDVKALIDSSKGVERQRVVESIKEQMLSYRIGLTVDDIPVRFLNLEQVLLADWLAYLNSLEGRKKKYFVEFVDKHRSTMQEAWYHGVKKERRIDSFRLRSFGAVSMIVPAYFERSIKYLGPLRNEPQPIYPALGLAEPTNVGMKGELSAAILHINKYKRIRHPSPVDKDGTVLRLSYDTSTLEKACEIWLSYLGVVENVQTLDKGKLGYELSVKTHCDDEWQDLTHVGVGVSQVLPIVLMSLLSEEDDVLIFEQPELHLHPKIQSRLCDFFIAISAWKRQCIIETHSEYLINRLRLRIAQSDSSDIRERSSIFFLNKEGGKTNFRTVDVNDFGAIKDWPEDFFDQTDIEIENILVESTRKMKKYKNGELK